MIDGEQFGWHPAMNQWRYMGHELTLLTQGKSIRWLVLFFEPSAGVVLSYRIDRSFYLLFGPVWTGLRLLALPLFFLLALLGRRHELCFKTEIGRGLQVLHPTLGVVTAGEAIIGQNCTLCGGNSIGARRGIRRGELVLGDNVFLGINACILGPARIGDRVMIGAGAVVVSDLPNDCTATGIPARPKTPAGATSRV